MRRFTLLNGHVRSVQYSLTPCRLRQRMSTMDREAVSSNEAFVERFVVKKGVAGPLEGRKFAVKDMYDVAGRATGFGNPQWKATHPVPEVTAPCVEALLDSGAVLVGKTHMDELAFSLFGENVHYGTPLNPEAPDRVPGGSSSGSASCVASGDVEFSLGSDTAGSVRVPASNCGLLGIRTTHGAVSLEHARPLAPKFDTVGWFAKDPKLFQDVGSAFFGENKAPIPEIPLPLCLLVCKDAFNAVCPEAVEPLKMAVQKIGKLFAGGVEEIEVTKGIGGGSLSSWLQSFRTVQGFEAWEQNRQWIETHKPSFGPGVKGRFETTATITASDAAAAHLELEKIRQHLKNTLHGNRLLCVPSAPGPAPFLQISPEEADNYRSKLISLTCIAGIGGCPEVSLPIARVSGAPVGIGLIGPQGSDSLLLAITRSILQSLMLTAGAVCIIPNISHHIPQTSTNSAFATVVEATKVARAITRFAVLNTAMPKVTEPVLTFWARTPPLAGLAVAKIGSFDVKLDIKQQGSKDSTSVLELPSGDKFSKATLLLYVAASGSARHLLGLDDALTMCQITQWLEYAQHAVNSAGLGDILSRINMHLALRTYLVGYSLTLADISIWGQLKGAAQWAKLRVTGNYAHLNRWFDFISSVPELKEVEDQYVVKKGFASPAEGQDAGKEGSKSGGDADTGSYNIDLPDAVMGKVVTRFPPEPSGFLHIGHAKAALLNQHIADMYKGKLIVRFDDTNPSKEKDEFADNILKDIADLGIKYDQLTYTSDHFEALKEIAVKLINAGKIYADDTPVEKMREERMDGIESARRGRSIAENLEIWKEMEKGSEIGLKNCMRIKIDMQAANKALRDPVVYRCNLEHHWRTGTKYKLYPTYDFACPYVDSHEGVTHAMRTSEYKDREAQFQFILNEMQAVEPSLPNVHVWEYSRLNFVYCVLSKRKLKWFVETERVSGWDDPRFPTVQGMFRRGLTLEALREFILSQGASKNVTLQSWEKLWSINKRLIDPVCPRHTSVDVVGKIPVTLVDGPETLEAVIVPKHKKCPDAGKKVVNRTAEIWWDQADGQVVQPGEEVTLMDWGNCIIQDIKKDASGQVTSIEAKLNLAGDFKKTKWKLTWLAQLDELVPLTIVDFNHLITKKKVEEGDNFESLVNPTTWIEKEAIGDPNMRNLNRGDILQLERKGYYIVDKPQTKPGQPVTLFNIPDGRLKKSE